MSYADYESFGVASLLDDRPELVEAYSGAEVVRWHGHIERQLDKMVQRYEEQRNTAYAEKIRAFLNTWRTYQITGSLNRETLDPLESAANILSVDGWKLQNFFGNLRDQLRALVASEEELPRDAQGGGETPPPGGMGGAPPPDAGGDSTAPMGSPGEPPPSDFGAEENPPGGGAPGAAGPGGDPNAAAPGGPADPNAPGAPPGAGPDDRFDPNQPPR